MESPQPVKTLYQLVAYESEFDGVRTYPLALARHTLGVFTSIAQAEAFIADELRPGHTFVDPLDLLRLHLFSFHADEERHFRDVRVYDPDGRLVGHEDFYAEDAPPAFNGRAECDCRYQPGELIQFIPGSDLDHLHLGIVLDCPFTPDEIAALRQRSPDVQLDATDDVYMILYLRRDGALSHEHVPEYRLAAPQLTVPAELEGRLRHAFAEKV